VTREITVDLFAGGGGASEGIEQALGVYVDEAVNHAPEAIEMHKANHPFTRHYTEDVFRASPVKIAAGRQVGLLWASPDCTHFSRAKAGKPVEKKIRGLAWVVNRWARAVRPRVIILENVPEFKEWGPLDKNNLPIKSKKGMTFTLWANVLRGLGYEVQYRNLCAADFGAPTIRTRLFMIARCDGLPIVWPEPTHGPAGNSRGLPAYRPAAECIDFSLPCPSIFERKKPLAENTLRRIAKGIQRYVIETKEPFVLAIDHQGGNGDYVWPLDEPIRAITQKNRFALVSTFLSKYHGPKSETEVRGQECGSPVKTIDTQNRFALVTAFLSKYYTGVVGSGVKDPMPTVTAVDHNALIATHLTKFYGTNTGSDVRRPLPTTTAGGQHIGEVRAFLVKYYNTNIGQSLRKPMHTVTGKHRLALVTVAGQQYQIADIGLRMLAPKELAAAQGFPTGYSLIGTKKSQVAKIGNSVPPPVAKALVRANVKLRDAVYFRTG